MPFAGVIGGVALRPFWVKTPRSGETHRQKSTTPRSFLAGLWVLASSTAAPSSARFTLSRAPFLTRGVAGEESPCIAKRDAAGWRTLYGGTLDLGAPSPLKKGMPGAIDPDRGTIELKTD